MNSSSTGFYNMIRFRINLSRQCCVNLRNDGLQFLILFTVHGDTFLARFGLHGTLIDIILSNVNIGFSLKLSNLKIKKMAVTTTMTT